MIILLYLGTLWKSIQMFVTNFSILWNKKYQNYLRPWENQKQSSLFKWTNSIILPFILIELRNIILLWQTHMYFLQNSLRRSLSHLDTGGNSTVLGLRRRYHEQSICCKTWETQPAQDPPEQLGSMWTCLQLQLVVGGMSGPGISWLARTFTLMGCGIHERPVN